MNEADKRCENCKWHFDLLGHSKEPSDPKNCLQAPLASLMTLPSAHCLYPEKFEYKGNWGTLHAKKEFEEDH